MIRNEGEQVMKEGVWGFLMRGLSRFLATEEIYTDQDLKLATEGAGFVVVHCPAELSEKTAWEVFDPLSPIAARHWGGPQG